MSLLELICGFLLIFFIEDSVWETTRGESSVAIIKAHPGHLHTKIYCPTHVLNNVIIYQQFMVRAFRNEINLRRVRTTIYNSHT